MKRGRTENLVYNDGVYEREVVVSEGLLRFIYDNPVGRSTVLHMVKRKFASRLYGRYCKTSMSARKIPRFIRENRIDMTGCDGIYSSFAEFFARERKDVAFPAEPNVLGSPAEGLAAIRADIRKDALITAKNNTFSMQELLGSRSLANDYDGGVMAHIRLTPANYHRIHFFDDGIITDCKHIDGVLHSVNPLAVSRIAKLYCGNKRDLLLFSSKNFGEVALVAVGATFVGSIVHCFEIGEPVTRGSQCSYFLPGGSLLIAFFKKGSFIPDDTLLKQTSLGYESKINIGAPFGYALEVR